MESLLKVVAVIAFILVVGMAFAYPVMLLWNGCLVPAIPAIKEVGWLQAWGIMVLSSFLFKDNFQTSK